MAKLSEACATAAEKALGSVTRVDWAWQGLVGVVWGGLGEWGVEIGMWSARPDSKGLAVFPCNSNRLTLRVGGKEILRYKTFKRVKNGIGCGSYASG